MGFTKNGIEVNANDGSSFGMDIIYIYVRMYQWIAE